MNDRQTRLDRRRALKALGLGAGAVALSSGTVQAKATPAEATPDTKPSGYRESPHVLAYYATLRK
ncbi:formate dehydrogenase region TAT target [Ferrimonas balearica DSM 9799]|uniref:Formate dehydrogenase region TAT target n=1 Tax=Ferrimonas balearica (strain DSM 9799 / CCM 4581 / KCTC 23876 / PAT) TaxID=550540 RepID=E1SNY0_FERBD|nr:twin-arginine translocation signal domain-containing protein [Ferrimonas balearica]MBY6019246.1 twin-arginine translocation signal domain-containing protein [Halomonas denitrificans]ADN77787.1 formate dehydrogenase region TAT target [Ferrimonas balearica DSM 9799]MBW3140846.1 twin-arginine translocation signal domain-containing protein [Ferrimonas balearica]MBW3165951.1 twin-arginine translocation signal domain-containing protein [Ferrimonas balearica]MBY5981861.1 twin-arginine translocatio